MCARGLHAVRTESSNVPLSRCDSTTTCISSDGSVAGRAPAASVPGSTSSVKWMRPRTAPCARA
eukprot:4279984-Prymnesium_polylepis.2